MNNDGYVGVRFPEKTIALIDDVCKIYGFSRSELLRAGAVHYCQQLLVTDSLQSIASACYEVAQKAHNGVISDDDMKSLDNLLTSLQGQLGLK